MVEAHIVIHDGERSIYFGAADDRLNPADLVFPGVRSDRAPLVMSSMEIDHKFGVWFEFHTNDVFHAQDDPKSICVQWRVTPEVLGQLEDIADGDYGIALMPIAEMLEKGHPQIQQILHELANAPSDSVTSELHDSYEPARSGATVSGDGSANYYGITLEPDSK
jgi:hypothetical protein